MSKTVVGISHENPHYFTINGELRLLISSAEHYGALVNRAFDYVRYFRELRKNGFNQTRLFAGSYFERASDFSFDSNPLAPGAENLVPLFAGPEKTRLHPEYVERLRAILAAADEAGAVVELTLFCVFYNEGNYLDSPLHDPAVDRREFFEALTEEQKRYVRLVLAELEPFDNVIVELINEPYWMVRRMEPVLRFQQELAELIRECAPGKPVAWNVDNTLSCAFDGVPGADVLNFHYMRPECVLANWHRQRPIVDDETGFCGSANRPYREEAYLALLAGAAGYSNLDMAYTVEAPDGTERCSEQCTHGGGKSFHRELAALAAFLGRFDFSKARPAFEMFRPECRSAALSLGGGRYLAYAAETAGKVLAVSLPAGEYCLRWFDPVTTELLKEEKHVSNELWMRPVTPPTEGEMLLEVCRVGTGD